MYTRTLAIPLLCAALGVACERSANDRAADLRSTQDARAGTQQVLLTGCLAPGPGGTEYVLRNVRMAPVAEQPSDALTSPRAGAITEGSWVRLRATDRDQLRSHLGQVVSVTGTITDDGRDMVGTGGRTASPDGTQPRTDQSQAAGREHHSERVAKEAGPIAQQSMPTGPPPELVVHRINGTGERCEAR